MKDEDADLVPTVPVISKVYIPGGTPTISIDWNVNDPVKVSNVAMVGFPSPSEIEHRSVLSPEVTIQEYVNLGVHVEGST